jgi:hypothetical protein
MAKKIAERKIIGTILIQAEGEEVTPVTPVEPEKAVENWLAEHSRLANIINRYGNKGECVSKDMLVTESKLPGDRVEQHLAVFEQHDFLGKITDEGSVCGRDAVRAFKKKLEVEL